MSPIFHIYVGTEKQHFTGHEAFLARSPKLKFLCAQDAKKGNVKGIRKFFFPMEHPESFGHLLEYLYLNIIAIPTSDSSAETRQLAGLFSVARRFQLHELQEDIIARFYHSQMSSRVSAMEFFSLAKDLFSEGMINSLEKYFAKEAPLLIKTLDDECFPELECMVAEGGPFAQALFAAYRAAFRPQTLGTGPKTPKELKEELSTSSNADGREYIKTEMQAETEYEHETEDEHETKRLKVSPPPWDDLNEADKFLVQLRAETGNWNQISKAWNKANGANASVKTLLDRYSHITAKWWSLNDGDVCKHNSPSSLLPKSLHSG